MAATVLETLMLILFGCSWPISIVKSYRSRSTGGKSFVFSCFILTGYLCGIAAKIAANNINAAFYVYILNTVMVFIDSMLWLRNHKLEQEAAQAKTQD